MKDYYAILGVSKDASSEEIKKAYRNLSKKYHPDVNPDGGEKFKEIAEAYDILSNPEKKQRFDSGGGDFLTGGFNMDDFFKNMGFNADPFGTHFNNQQRVRKAPDKIIELIINPVESFLGVQKEIKYSRKVNCKTCDGSGGDKKVCQKCNGYGILQQTVGTGFFNRVVQVQCDACSGSGYQIIRACVSCVGSGLNVENHGVNVNVPKNVDNGDFLRIQSQGDYHVGIGFGDVILKITMERKDNFEKNGIDLVYYTKLNALDFYLLDKPLIINHPTGELRFNLPDNVDTEKPLRLRGKGYETNMGVGDLYVRLSVNRDNPPTPEYKEKIKGIVLN